MRRGLGVPFRSNASLPTLRHSLSPVAMNSGGTALLDRFKLKSTSAPGATPSYTGGQWLKEGQNLFSSGFVRVVSCQSGELWQWKLCSRESETLVLQAVIPVGEMETHKLQQWARTFQAYSHVRLHLLCTLEPVAKA